ncbi:Triacylglycerol lipase [Ascochyta rabiei]|nr:Triacylglycerol lipase [Ascochyta rabiei]UPX13356.1 Triacylglycerol lipase [Ascochyta rabiei]
MSAQNSAGIQTLLDAERDAQKIVQQARECKRPPPSSHV